MKHVIVTRCKFNKEEDFENYFKVMEKIYIPAINSQKNKNFSIALICKENHFEIIKKLIDGKINLLRFEDTKTDYKEYVIKNNIQIQTRHDCDDFMSEDYIEFIQKNYNDNKNKYESFILNFHPTKFDFETNKEYSHARDYSKVCSMFSSLIQQKVNHGVFDVVHDRLNTITKNIIYIPAKGQVKLVVHGKNKLSKINPNDKSLN